MTNNVKQEELLDAINTVHLTEYSEDPAVQLNQQNYRIKALINQQVIQALERAKTEAKDIGFGNGEMVSVKQLEDLIKEYKGDKG